MYVLTSFSNVCQFSANKSRRLSHPSRQSSGASLQFTGLHWSKPLVHKVEAGEWAAQALDEWSKPLDERSKPLDERSKPMAQRCKPPFHRLALSSLTNASESSRLNVIFDCCEWMCKLSCSRCIFAMHMWKLIAASGCCLWSEGISCCQK